jgi:hypothetical protein
MEDAMSWFVDYLPYVGAIGGLITALLLAYEVWRRSTVAGWISTVLHMEGRQQALARAKLIKAGRPMLPILDAERRKLAREYLALREQQGRPVGATIIRDPSEIPVENLMLMEADACLAAIMEAIESTALR